VVEIVFWKDKGKQQITIDLFSVKAEEIIKSISFKDNRGNEKRELDKNQIRRFYNDVVVISSKINNAKDKELEFEKQLPYLNMINAKVAYSKARKLITGDNFSDYIKKSIQQVNDLDDFKVFCSLFESVIAYFGK